MFRRRHLVAVAAMLVAALGVGATAVPAASAQRRAAPVAEPVGRTMNVRAPDIVGLIGDSLSASLVDGFASESERRGLTFLDGTTNGCGLVRGDPTGDDFVPLPFTSGCDEHVRFALDGLVAEGPDVVLWLSSWETAHRIVDGKVLRFGTRRGDARLLELIHETARRITANGTPLVFLTVPHRTTRPGLVADFMGTPYDVEPESKAEARAVDRLNDLLRRYVAAHPRRTALVDLDAMVCPSKGRCPFRVEGLELRPDDGCHFAGDGPAWVARRVLNRLSGRRAP